MLRHTTRVWTDGSQCTLVRLHRKDAFASQDRVTQHGTTGQVDQPAQPGDGKVQAGLLFGALWIVALIGPGVRHGNRGAIEQDDAPPAPSPRQGCPRFQAPPHGLIQRVDQALQQALQGLAVGRGIEAARALPPGNPLGAVTSHDILASGVIGYGALEALEENHRD